MANIFSSKLIFNGVFSLYERCQHCQQVKGGDPSTLVGTDEGMSGVLGTMSSVVSNLPKMSVTEVTLLIWGYVQ